MKKISFLACAALIAFASCGNKTAQSVDGQDTVAVELETPAVADSLTAILGEELKAETPDVSKLQVTLATLQTKYAELVKEGKLEEAKVYASAVQNYINENAETLKSLANNNTTISSLIDGIKALPTSAEATADDALAAVKSDVQAIANTPASLEEAANNAATEVANAAQTAAQNKVNEVKTAAQNKVDEAKANAKAQVEAKANEAKTKANEAVNKAVNDATNKLLGK